MLAAGKAGYMYIFLLFTCKNYNAGVDLLAVSHTDRLYICVFVFPLLKIIMRGQFYKQLVRPIVYICFCFSVYKNCSVKAAIPAAKAFLSKIFLAFCAFSIVKFLTRG